MTATVYTPLLAEWLALRGDLATWVIHTGRSKGRSTEGPALVAGVAGALTNGIAVGDVVVATEVRHRQSVKPCRAAELVAGELGRLGLTVHTGPIVTSDHVVDSPRERGELAASGAIAVDTESGLLAGDDGLTVVVRVVVDTPSQRLRGIGMPRRGAQALKQLRRTAPGIDAWAAATGERELLLATPRSFLSLIHILLCLLYFIFISLFSPYN
ncbi:5'-methylthioadenosine/S-adenosylhomocysteine nucleosidase family protein [Kribbella sp. NPDC054772]